MATEIDILAFSPDVKQKPRTDPRFLRAEKEGLSELCERCFLDSLCEDRKMRHAQHAFKARLFLTKALLKVKPVDDSTGFRERRRRDLKANACSNIRQ